MRLYLSSYRLGNHPEKLAKLFTKGKRVGIIMNAGDGDKSDVPQLRGEWIQREADSLAELGLEPSELDLRPYFSQSNTKKLRTALNELDGLWVLGGNSFVLRRAFRMSGLDELLIEFLAEDKLVYAGYSAGIDQLVPNLRGVDLVDNPHLVPEGYESEVVWDALRVLPFAIAPHYQSDHPESADIDRTVQYLIDHHTPFIALRDGEVIIQDGDNVKVYK